MSQCLEIVRLRAGADRALERFEGFLGSELTEGANDDWTLIVRWASRRHVEAAQTVTLGTPGLAAITAWTSLAREFVSFETVEVRRAAPAPKREPALAPAIAADISPSNLAIGLRFATEGLGKADMKAFDELVDGHVVVTTGLSPKEPIRGREAYKQVFAGFADAWPATSFKIENSFAVGDKVVVEFTAMTIFRKDYYGVKANHVVAPLREVHVYTVRDGRIVENVVGAINLPFEFTMYPALKDAVLGGLEVAR